MVQEYNAPKPKYSRWEWFKSIAVRIVFPPVLLWDFIKLVANKSLGERVGKIILPAQTSNFDSNIDKDIEYAREPHLSYTKYQVKTHDGAVLDTLEIQHVSQNDENIDPQYQKYLINFVGNADCYENNFYDMRNDAKALETNVVGFNLRGVSQSTGKAKSRDDLVTDGIAQVQRLLDKGVSPQNITLKGHSLGGAVSTLVAQHFHQSGQPINLFNSRSFSTLTNVLVGDIRLKRNEYGKKGHQESFGRKVLGGLLKPFIKFGIVLVKWEMNAGRAYKSIPDTHKDYIVVRSSKDGIVDHTLPHSSSVHKYLTSERRKQKAAIDKQIKAFDSTAPQRLLNNGLSREELVKARDKFKARKMKPITPGVNGHNENLENLYNRQGVNAQTFFHNFFNRAIEDHGQINSREIEEHGQTNSREIDPSPNDSSIYNAG